jgi:hypothetical protein
VFARGRTGWLALSTPLAVGCGLAAAAGLASAWGIAGIGGAYLLTYLLLALGTTVVQRKVAEHPWWPPVMPAVVALWIALGVAGAALPVSGAVATVRVAVAALLAVAGVLALRRRRGAGSAG